LKVETCYLDRVWKERFCKSEEKLNKCYKTVLEALLTPEELGYEPVIYLVNFFFRFETWQCRRGTYHVNWIINGPDPVNRSINAIFLPVQTIERLATEDLMATLAHELHEIVGKAREGELNSEISLEEAKQVVHKRRMYDVFREPIRSLLIAWDATPNRIKRKKVRVSKTPKKTFCGP